MLRQIGIEAPKWHEVGSLLKEHHARFTKSVLQRILRLAKASKWLRKERELSFYGRIHYIPANEYSTTDALRAIIEAR